ncbi:DUF2784 domain-containing protein [Catelliglobosispora koreensis]|uniref:DUF2784 domain-containing protein n=1 Tax=Catelliglobosispora koreensis TaxID=129052 RepID=UPI0009FE5F37|nr:DUF2784 domain-containing protein [Catelliglobosispora koreensis]
MWYRLLGDVTMVFHFAFLVYVTLGGFLAWWRPWLIWPHIALAGWGFSTVLVGFDCPLTYVENWARDKAGQQGLEPTGFIDTYIEGVIYPEQYTNLLRALVAGLVLVSWIGAFIRWRARKSRRPEAVPHNGSAVPQ